MRYHKLGNTGMNVSAVVYGGIVSAGFYDGVNYPEYGQKSSDQYRFLLQERFLLNKEKTFF